MPAISTIEDVVSWRMCLGCGACAYVCPEKNVRLLDVLDEGIRPVRLDAQRCRACNVCLDVCPAYENDHSKLLRGPGAIHSLDRYGGPVLEIWEGHACDSHIRFQGSSGGALTALALYCLENEHMAGVLQVGQDPQDPIHNQTRLSRSKEELLACTGSRYAPASACDRLDLIEDAGGPCVFVGQPSEVTALRKAQRLKPGLDKNVGLALSFFCAGSPSTRGTLELLKKLDVQPASLHSLRYRGKGWPGRFSTATKDREQLQEHLSYRESWSILQAYRPYSTHLWPDGTGEDADISCGDPWYREIREDEPGSSLVVVRTERGREIVQRAMKAGYLELNPAEPWKLLKSQENLTNKRRTIWGRRLAFHVLGLPVTRLKGFSLFRLWLGLPFKEKLRSTLGTARRIIQRKYYRPAKLL